MIKARSRPPGFDEGSLAEQVGSWWEGWMRQADQVLEDEQLVTIVYDALTRRHPKSRIRGRWGAPAEVVSSTGISHGATPEVPVGAHPQPNP